VGDVLLVHDEAAIEESFSLFGYYNVIGSEIVTENGVYLGKVSLDSPGMVSCGSFRLSETADWNRNCFSLSGPSIAF
jgi:hypothetical protein